MILKDVITETMAELSSRDDTIFIGYNLKYGSRCYGTMDKVPDDKIIEMPVAEYLMTGMAIGMAINGYRPVLIFERHDFLLMAMDQIVNHLDKINNMSLGQYTTPVIIRAIVGADEPLYPGPQHCQDYTALIGSALCFPTRKILTAEDCELYKIRKPYGRLLTEYRNLYNKEV